VSTSAYKYAVVAFLILGAAGCGGRRATTRAVLIDDERVFRVVAADTGVAFVGADTIAAAAAVDGWYVMSPGRVARIAEKLRRAP